MAREKSKQVPFRIIFLHNTIFFATAAELTDQKAGNTDGISFLPVLLGKKQPQHEYLYFEYPEKNGQLAIRMGNWESRKNRDQKNPANPWMLFDLSIDRNETTNVAAQHPELLKQFDSIVAKRTPGVTH